MRDSEKYIEYNKIEAGNLDRDDVVITNPEYLAMLAHKEGYLEAIDKLTKKFKELQERHWMCTYKDVLYVIENMDN